MSASQTMTDGAGAAPGRGRIATPRVPDLSRPMLVATASARGAMRSLTVILSLAVLALVGWAGFATVNEVSVARGMIVPAQFERVIQHLDGGLVRQILVRPGERVEAGATLFVLDDASTTEDLSVATRRRADIEARIEGLVALAEDRAPDFSRFEPEIADDASDTYRTQRDAIESQRQLITSQIEQARYMATVYDAQMASLEDDQAFATENFERIESLVEKGFATRALLSERRKAMSDALNAITIAREKRKASSEQLVEAEKRLASFLAETASEQAANLQQLRTELAALSGDVSRSARRQRRLTVTSPVRGIVKSLEVKTIGGVAKPGQPLATVVPVDEELNADTRVAVSEIGYVRPGMPAHVKISAYDFTRFGWIEGTVTSISPSAFVEDGEDPYYEVRLVLASDHLPGLPEARLSPGMMVEADIVTGEKSVLAYFLSPIRKALGSAFAER